MRKRAPKFAKKTREGPGFVINEQLITWHRSLHGIIYTMNVSEKIAKDYQYPVHFGVNQNYLARIFGQAETLCAYETLQFEDYAKYVFNYFDPAERRKKYEKSFPDNCHKAFELGVRLAGPASAEIN